MRGVALNLSVRYNVHIIIKAAQMKKIKNILPLTEARGNIFALADAAQNSHTHYTLTERGVPKIIVLSVKKFEELSGMKESWSTLSDGGSRKYAPDFQNGCVFSKTLIIRDESRVVYLAGNDQNSRYREEGLIKSQLFVNLIETYGYPLNLVELGRYVKIGGATSKKYVEADIITNDERGNVTAIFEVSQFSEYEKNLDTIAADLFSLANTLSWVKKPRHLIYFSRSSKNGVVQEKITVIDFLKFNTFISWKKAGRPCSQKIPGFNERLEKDKADS